MRKILIVEDEILPLAMLKKAILRLGHMPLCCTSGDMAWQVLQDNPDVHLMITDVVLPGLDGRDLVARVRAEENFCNLPIIIVSGRVGIKEICHLLDLGASRFMPKPIKQDDLTEYVNLLCDKYEPSERLHTSSRSLSASGSRLQPVTS